MSTYIDTSSSNVPAFLSKLWMLVEEESTDELICWDPSGKSFHVYDQGRFAKEILPLYFKHNNIASFIRQLNMYGFRKVAHVEQGGLKVEKDDMEFAHQYFVRDQEHLLEHIKRKISTGKGDDMKVKPDDVNRVLTDVRQMKGKQENMSSKLESMKRENEALWREVATLRQKHQKQQQIVNKLIQFLVTMVSQQRGLAMKRKMPLMINDASQLQPAAKIKKIDSLEDMPQNFSPTNPQGVRIYEVVDTSPRLATAQTTAPEIQGASNTTATTATDPLTSEQENALVGLDSILQADNDLSGQPAPLFMSAFQPAKTSVPTVIPTTTGQKIVTTVPVTSQQEQTTAGGGTDPKAGITRWVQPSGGASQPAIAAGPLPTAALHSPKIDEVSDHLDVLQADLDTLKDMLSGNQYSLDASTILGLFNPEGPIPQTPDYSTLFGSLEEPLQEANANKNVTEDAGQSGVVGNELVSYDPNNDTYSSLYDFPDPLLGDDSIGLLTDAPVGLAPSSTLNTPEVETTPMLTVTSPLANKRKKNSPSRRKVVKTESVD